MAKTIEVPNGLKLHKYVRRIHSGQFFNPVFAAEITARVRSRLVRDVQGHENRVIRYSTDGIAFTKPVKLDIGEDLGQWAYEGKYHGLIIGNGVYSFSGLDSDKQITKMRGFGRSNVIEIAMDHPTEDKYTYTKERPLKLKETRKTDFRTLCRFVPIQRTLNINFDHKRDWQREAIDFQDLLNSRITSKPLMIK